MKKISVIVPIYNQEKRLEKCLDSLVNQTYKNIEIILINDGSTDKTIDIINKYKEKYNDKIIVIDRENRGISASRNEGLAIASGDYIGFVDSDDYAELDMFEKLYNELEKQKADIVVCDYFEFNDNLSKIVKVGEGLQFNCTLKDNPKLINGIDYAPWNKLYDKKLFENIIFPLNTKYEDLSTILKLFSKANKIIKLNEPLYGYYINPIGETATINIKNLQIYEIIEDIINYFKFLKEDKEFWLEIEKLCVRQLYYIILNSSKHIAKSKIKEYIKNSICLLDKNFKGWRKRNLKIYNFIKKIIITNIFIYCLYIDLILENKKNKKKIIFFMHSLDFGGTETSLISLLKNLNYDKYEVSLLLENAEGPFLNDVPNTVKIINYNLSKDKNLIKRKIINRMKLIFWVLINYHKYDCSIDYVTYSKLSSTLALSASKKSLIWIHSDYAKIYENEKEFNNFFEKIKIKKFSKIVFVSNFIKENIVNKLPFLENNSEVIYNIIDACKIIESSKDKVKEKSNKKILLYVGRISEKEKNISMLIDSIEKLRKIRNDFELLVVGDGPDKEKYMNLVKKYNLDDVVKFLGFKKNPFPYYKLSKAILLCSNYEGNPVVFTEAMVMRVPIITTNIADAKSMIDKKYGIVTGKNIDEFVNAINLILEDNFEFSKQFDFIEYNSKSLKKIYDLIDFE